MQMSPTNNDGQDFAVARYNSDGSLDTDFGVGGFAVTDIGISNDVATAVAIQSDGKIVAAGYTNYTNSNSGYDEWALIRYNSDGSLDATFGNGGIALADFGSSSGNGHANAMAIQPDGKIVAAGYAHAHPSGDFALARFTLDGSLDTSFSGDGMVTTRFAPSSDDQAYAMALQSDGNILAAGYSNTNNVRDFALARFDSGRLHRYRLWCRRSRHYRHFRG